jgi:hypothetical protein
MGTRNPTEILRQNRMLISGIEVSAFEKALKDLAATPQAADVKELLLVFADECEHQEVMWGLLHFIESLGMERNLEGLVDALPSMLQGAPEWAEIIHCRILNDETYTAYYKDLLSALPESKRAVVETVLGRIKEKDAEFGPTIDWLRST